MFNPKAWSNTDLMLAWIKHIYTPSSEYPLFPRHSTTRPPRFLSLDVFSGQKTKEVITSFKALKCTTSFIPGGTTGFIQVCDTVINKSLKDRIEELADQYVDEHEREWVEGKYTVSQRRVLLTKWVGQAWEDMHTEDSDMIRQAFVQVGLGLPIDGSQDHEIKTLIYKRGGKHRVTINEDYRIRNCYGLDPLDVLVPKAPAISSFLNYRTMCYLGNLSKHLYLY